jgi:CHASE2 domain-containing sensor protein
VALIFVSYRRADAGKTAWRLFDWLERQFGAEGVFFDREGIEPGEAFPQVLEQQLNECQVLIALIGLRWLSIADDQGNLRLRAAHDYVAHEVATALRRGIRVVPVLVDGATMPAADQLPPALAAFADKQALAIDDAHFATDFERLVDAVEGRPRGWRERERDRARRLVRHIKRTSFVVPVLVPVVFFAAWVGLFNLIGIDTQIASYTMLLSDQSTPVAQEGGVVVVGLDQATEQQLGRTYDGAPEWRADHARLIDRLSSAGAAAVALDFFFERETPFDGALAEAVKRAAGRGTRVVFGVREVEGGQPHLAPAFSAAGSRWGLLCLGHKHGYLFTTPLARSLASDVSTSTTGCNRADLPALAVAASFDGTPADVCSAPRSLTIVSAPGNGTSQQISHLPVSEIERIRTTPAGCPALNREDLVATNLMVLSPVEYWRRRPQRYAYGELHSPPSGFSFPDLRGKTVVVGVTTEAARDVHVVQRGLVREERFGLELQADAVRNLLSGFSLQPVSMAVQFALIVCLALLGAVMRFATARWGPAPKIALPLASMLAYFGLSVVLSSKGILLNPLYDIVAFGLAYRILGWLEARADAAVVTGAMP